MLNKSKIFAQFVSSLFGGAIFAFLTIYYFILVYGFSTPYYAELLTIFPTIIGVILTAVISQKYNHNLFKVILSAFFILPISIIFIMGTEDWIFPTILSGISIIYSIIPATIVTLLINWRKFSKKKH
jgi:hypothetical protein